MLKQKLSGKFIVFEGIEGTGKSTIINFLEDYLKKLDIAPVLTREPGGTALGNEVRQIFLNHSEENISGEVEALLIFAARKHHLQTIILPNLADNKCVICDRFTDSTYAYQAYGRGVDANSIKNLEDMVQQGFLPDLVFILDVPVDIGIERARGRGELDRVESSSKEFFEKSRQGFLERAALDPNRYVVIDTSKPLEEVKEQVIAGLNNHDFDKTSKNL